MPLSAAILIALFALVGRQTGTALGAAISGNDRGVGLGPRRGGVHQHSARRRRGARQENRKKQPMR